MIVHTILASMHDLFYPTIKLAIEMLIFAFHQRWRREQPPKVIESLTVATLASNG
jgi:hypothetical protein